jgi:coenzyme Q-binding protein COQ10
MAALVAIDRPVAGHSDECLLPYSVEEVFDLIADVESYPDFLPYWRRATIQRREGNTYFTTQEVGLGPFCERFESQTTLERPKRIEITSSADMFRRLELHWEFEPVAENACRVRFTQECDARSPLAQTMLDVMFYDVARSTLKAFKKRARDILGTKKSDPGAWE